jgi:hypothetical protein
VVERDIVAVTEAFNTDAVLHQKVLGLLEGVPLHGGATIPAGRPASRCTRTG